jgi:RNA polymerase sigma-70 factor (ECF subfamily)
VQGVGAVETADAIAEALRSCATGDQSAMATLYDLTSAKVYGLALRVLRNPAHAEEVTQEIYVEAWQRSDTFQPGRGSALSWLLTITHRRAVDRVRSAEASAKRDQAYGADDPAASPVDPADQAVATIEAERVRGALTSLTDTQRQAVELAYYDGLTHREVAHALDVPLGTAKARIRDGLIRLRSALGGD